jgi:hypothetical protein
MMGVRFEEEKPRPLTMELETAKGIIMTAVNKAKAECGIPNFIMEGIIADIHSQVTSQSKVEMINDFNMYLDELKKEEETEGKGEE